MAADNREFSGTNSDLIRILTYAMNLKKKMIEKGLRVATVKVCPRCKKGTIQIALAGKKNHVHMACSTPGCIMLME